MPETSEQKEIRLRRFCSPEFRMKSLEKRRNTLTSRQLMFLENVFEKGMNQTQAYIEAYNYRNKRKYASIYASQIFALPKIQEYIKSKIFSSTDIKNNIIKTLTQIVNSSKDERSRIEAIKVLNKLFGLYKSSSQSWDRKPLVIGLPTETVEKQTEKLSDERE